MGKTIIVALLVLSTAAFSKETHSVSAPAISNEIIFYAQPGNGIRSQIFSVNSGGTGQVNISNDPSSWNSYPSWAPDASKIIFSKSGEIWMMDPLGSNEIKLAGGGAGGAINPVLSPNGDSIAYIYDGHGFQAASILIFSFSDVLRELTLIGPHDSSGRDWNYGLDWSPDGSKIVFTRVESDNRRSNIYIINADGSGEVALTQSNDHEFSIDPSWSPDGSKIVYCSPDGISVMNADGSGKHRIATLSANFRHPSWSPDGSQIVFSAMVDEDPFLNVFRMEADGSNIVKLTQNMFDSLGPKWKPAQMISVSGRVLTPNGQGLRNAVVNLFDSSGNRRSVVTSTLGYYSFSDVKVGETVTITAVSKRYRFEPLTRAFDDSLTEINFVGME